MIAELRAKVSMDTSDLNKGQLALRQFEETAKGAFKRTGDLRAGRAFESFGQNLLQGNVPGAIESITSRLTGLGLVWGTVIAGIGAGATFLVKSFHESEAAVKAAHETAKERPIAGASDEQLDKHVEESFKKLETLSSRAKEVWAIVAGSAINQGDIEQKKRQDERHEAVKSIIEDYEKEATNARKALESEAMSDAVGQKGLTIVKARIEAEQKYAQIRQDKMAGEARIGQMHMLNPEDESELRGEVGERAKDQRRIADERLGLIQRQVDMEDQLAAIKREAVTPEIQALEITQTRIGYLEQIRSTLSATNTEGRKAVDHATEQLKLDQAHVDTVNAAKTLQPAVEATQLSFKDLLGADPKGGSIARIEAHNAAIRAQREMDIAARLTAGGFQEQAFVHQARAENIKAGIPLLKESEKNPALAFLTAVNSASVFQNMKNYLETIAKSVSSGTNPFLNKP